MHNCVLLLGKSVDELDTTKIQAGLVLVLRERFIPEEPCTPRMKTMPCTCRMMAASSFTKSTCHRGQGHNCHCHGGVKRSNEERSSGCGIFRRGQLVCEWYDTVCDYYWVAIWSTSSSTYGQSPYWLEYSDYTGDLEVWVKNPDRVGWRAGTNTWGSFCIQNDGNLVLYSQSDNPVWASNTFSGWQKRSNSTEDTI
ncbi:hypothetical protein BDR26DRAFT_206265 [Obelidium mucronatum]|nr:hypothetical protein BDR26DRAFT_206265 [Obelidium mucronatum]